MPVLQQGDKLIDAAQGIDAETIREPLGVFGMIPPYNFPAMVPFWFLPYAIAAGNTYVVKPSEQVPCTFQRITELLEQTGLPPGVVNVVNGDKAAAMALIENRQVAGISFVGSTKVARLVVEACARTGKRVQALGSAKNHLVVMPDANMDEVIRNLLTSCYGCAGQRCMAASAIVAVGDKTHQTLCSRFIEASRGVLVADPLDPAHEKNPMLMGPVISKKALETIHRMIEVGIKEGATLALDGRAVKVQGRGKGHFIGPTVFTNVKPGMEIHRTELFSPVVVVLKTASLDEAIGIINSHEYGNGASIYTQDGYAARKFKVETRAGMLGVNIGIPAPVAYLPFGGMKASFLSDIKGQGREVVRFFTASKVVTERYWPGK